MKKLFLLIATAILSMTVYNTSSAMTAEEDSGAPVKITISTKGKMVHVSVEFLIDSITVQIDSEGINGRILELENFPPSFLITFNDGIGEATIVVVVTMPDGIIKRYSYRVELS